MRAEFVSEADLDFCILVLRNLFLLQFLYGACGLDGRLEGILDLFLNKSGI